MALPADLQEKQDAAQKQLDIAKQDYNSNITRYNDWVNTLQKCYKDRINGVADALTWFMPTYGPCTAKGSCSLSNCKNTVDTIRNNVIPTLRQSNVNLTNAQNNFNKVLNEIGQDINQDPTLQKEKAKILADAAADKIKWIYFGISTALIIIGSIFSLYKTNVKKAYIISGGIVLIIIVYLMFFGFKKLE